MKHRDAGTKQSAVGQPAMRDHPGREPEIRLGLAAAGRKEQQIRDLAIVVRRVHQPA